MFGPLQQTGLPIFSVCFRAGLATRPSSIPSLSRSMESKLKALRTCRLTLQNARRNPRDGNFLLKRLFLFPTLALTSSKALWPSMLIISQILLGITALHNFFYVCIRSQEYQSFGKQIIKMYIHNSNCRHPIKHL